MAAKTELPMAQKYTIVKMTPNDLDVVYRDFYCKNNAEYDEILEMNVLSDNRHYNQNDFLDLLDDENTYSFIANEKVFRHPGYVENKKKGFICFEKLGMKHENSKEIPTISILFLESEKDDEKVYVDLLNYVYQLILDKGFFKKVVMEVNDGRWNQIKGLLAAGFKSEKTVRGKDVDVYIYSKELPQL
jgi:hypothetical protein